MGIEQITSQDVRVALCHLGHDRAPGAGPLAELAVVRARLREAGFADEAGARSFELARLLAELVEQELWLRRQRAGLDRDGGEPGAMIRADFTKGHVELEALSAIYHLYVRSDLGLSLDAFVRRLGDRHRRTVQRRLEHGVALVTHRLRELERDAELGARRRRCVARLPAPPESPIGVESLVARLADALDARSGRPVALGGIGGIGKTTVARAAAVRLIEEGRLEDVIWVRAGRRSDAWTDRMGADARPDPRGVGASARGARKRDGARSARPSRSLLSGAIREEVPGTYGDWPVAARPAIDGRGAGLPGLTTLVVIDGLDRPKDALRAARDLAARATAAPVLLVGRAGWEGVPSVEVLRVPPLPLDGARRLLDQLAVRSGAKPVGEPMAVARLVAATAGIPAAIERAAEALRVHDAGSLAAAYLEGRGVARDVLEAIWSPTWNEASPSIQRAVRAVLALKAAGIATHACSIGAHLQLTLDEAGELLTGALDHGLIESTPGPRRPIVHPMPLLERFLAARDSAPCAA